MRRFIGLVAVTLSIVAGWSAQTFAARHPSVPNTVDVEGQKIEEAYRYLESLPAQWAGIGTPSEANGELDCHTYDSAHIRGLSPEMALKTAAMARAYKEEMGVELMVLSAYRSEHDQACVCKNVPKHCAGWRRTTVGKDKDGKPLYKMIKTGGHSRHEHRNAIDLRPAYVNVADDLALEEAYQGFYWWLKVFEKRFGLHHPLFHIGDRAHIELSDGTRMARSAKVAKKKRRFARR